MALRGETRTELQWTNDLRTYVVEVAPVVADLEHVLGELQGTIALDGPQRSSIDRCA